MSGTAAPQDSTERPTRGALPLLVGGAAAVVLFVGIGLVASVVTIVTLAALATVLLVPLQARLLARGTPAWVALLAALAVYVGVLAVAGLCLLVGMAGLLRDLPALQTQLADFLAGVAEATGGPGTPPPVDASDVADAVRSVASSVLGTLSVLGYSVIVAAYLLLEAPRAPERLRHAFGPATETVARGSALALRLRRYVVARTVLGAIAAILDVVLLLILGIPSALLWGVLSFLLSFVPNVGFILALIPPTVLALITGGPLLALAVIAGYTIINVALDYVIQPRFVGASVDLAAVVVTVCLLFWAIVLGPAGALLAVPLTIVVAAICDAYPETRSLSRLLGQGPVDAATVPGDASLSMEGPSSSVG
jgi:predicted PurR-regulated permease PerM